MIKYYSVTNNEVVEHNVNGEAMERVYYKLNKHEFETLHDLALDLSDSSDEETLNFITRVLSASTLSYSSNLKIIKAFLVGEFVVDFSKQYAIHVLPGDDNYLNFTSEGKPFISYMYPREVFKSAFTKDEIEDMKKDERFRAINFDECLEEVQEDED